MKAKFIVIEGLEGAGKSSAIQTTQHWLEQQGAKVVLTREPGGTPLAETLRTLVKEPGKEAIAPQTELLLMYASRVQLVENVIKPAIEQGCVVLGDRHDMSSRAYQGGGRQLGDKILCDIKQAVLGDFEPDVTLYLDIAPEIGLARAKARGELDRIEREELAFFQRTRDKYLSLAEQSDSTYIINAEQQIDKVQSDILDILKQVLTTEGGA